jgi:hypothetical protein
VVLPNPERTTATAERKLDLSFFLSFSSRALWEFDVGGNKGVLKKK